MECPICKKIGKMIFKGKILQKHMVQYYQCTKCGFVYTEKPYWLGEAYSDAIASIDTGIMNRNVDNVLMTNMIVKFFFCTKKNFLDYGGGYGIFTRMMRDLGYNWLWQDKYAENLLARGFEYKNEKIELITAFEVFEHLENPMDELEEMFTISDTILFSTLLYDEDMKWRRFNNWWYYVPEGGQHISFYSKKTLEYIAEKYKVNYYKISDSMHLYTKKNLDERRLRILTGSKLLQWLHFCLNRKNGRASNDMKIISKKNRMK